MKKMSALEVFRKETEIQSEEQYERIMNDVRCLYDSLGASLRMAEVSGNVVGFVEALKSPLVFRIIERCIKLLEIEERYEILMMIKEKDCCNEKPLTSSDKTN